MKLLSRYNRTSFLATILVLLVSGVCYYFMVRYVLLHQLDKDLKVEEQEINDYVKANNALPKASVERDQETSFTQVTTGLLQHQFISYSVFDKREEEYDSRRKLMFGIHLNGNLYIATVSKSQIETEDLLDMIFFTTIGMILLLLVILFVVNRFLFNKLWHPFNETLQAVKQFNFSNANNLKLGSSNIDEFKELNNSVNTMTERIKNDYASLKNFTENAAHEMQTPLAVIYSKLDLLIQDEGAGQERAKHLQGIYSSVNKLTKLNKSLLLLTKIENNQFNEKEVVQVNALVEEKLMLFEETIKQKDLDMSSKLEPASVDCNKELMEILIGNLISNAIRYNVQNGAISLQTTGNSFNIGNTSTIPALDRSLVFQRFYRHNETKQDGNGLGLSIVKQICDVEGFVLDYTFTDKQHVFSIRFK